MEDHTPLDLLQAERVNLCALYLAEGHPIIPNLKCCFAPPSGLMRENKHRF